MPKDPETLAHLEWLGYVQPVGLVVSIPALLAAQAHVGRISPTEHQAFLSCLPRNNDDEIIPEIPDFGRFAQSVLGWEASDLQEPPASLEVALPEYHEALRPTFVVPEFQPKNSDRPWLMLVQCLPKATNCDAINIREDRNWQATPQARFERLLRETEVPIGLLFNQTQLRLVYAPRGESSGYATFSVPDMAAVAGRPIFAALHMLLSTERLFSLPEKQRLPAILADSRKYQNVVSTQLAEQVLAALYELLRGFQAADDAMKGQLLHDVLAKDPNHVYAGLLTVLMRLVFILYAEDRGLLSTDSVYVNYYSVTGLFERLRADAGRYPDTMTHRYGAWAQLLTLFRLIHEGGSHAGFQIPARKGYLFDPERYPFLEGAATVRERSASPLPDGRGSSIPRVSDGVLFQVLSNLLILDGERLSYRTLDVEQIGSVYETIMGFNLEVARGRSIAIKPAKAHGAPVTINLEALLQVPAKDRGKWVKEQADQGAIGAALNALKVAETPEALVAALERKVARDLTPNIVPPGGMVLQPSDERRRSGSHYTPRSLTEPIVRKALEKLLVVSSQLSETSGSEQLTTDNLQPATILGLKVCDPAMGSGAFLVETCRQLGDVLVTAWHAHNCLPRIPPDEDEVLHARRLVAQRCLYGVDKNPMAVDLAKLSLWLATLAKDHPFTFLDHALRCGDSLVGLTREQIVRFHWKDGPQQQMLGAERVTEALAVATRTRQEILDAPDEYNFDLKQQKLASADGTLNLVRLAGNLVVAAFFGADKDRRRQDRRDELLAQLTESLRTGNMSLLPRPAEKALREGPKGITPFHWEIEFPEVFGRESAGFDCFVGNPPFMGGSKISSANGDAYLEWLLAIHPESHGNGDLVAHFYRRAFNLLRDDGTFGLIATNTIAQGDTRTTGLRWIGTHGGTIYAARRRYKWPGQAAVVVSVVHVHKGSIPGCYELDGKNVTLITAYLFHAGGHENPAALKANASKSFLGCKIYGQGFTFDDSDHDGIANSIALMRELIAKDKRNAERIFPYIGGEEVNDSPKNSFHRYVINFGDLTEEEARRWPDLMKIVEEKIKPERMKQNREIRKRYWWRFGEPAPALYRTIRGARRVLANSQVSPHLSFAFLPSTWVYSHALNVFALSTSAEFCVLQCRVHEIWARFFASSMKDDLRYTPSDCFETFPFPEGFETHPTLESVGQSYYEFRAALMVRNNEGLTKTYNRFHDPNERSADIVKLRELHAAMDRAVLDAYGWTDLHPTCAFLLDYEDEEEEDRSLTVAARRKKPWRYRWPDDIRDEVLAKLLELNKQRAEQEALAGAAIAKPKKSGRKKAPRQAPGTPGLY